MCGMGREESADSVREMYFSRFGLDAGGGFQSELPLNRCWGEWLIAKKVFDSERSGESLLVRQQAFCSRQFGGGGKGEAFS